MKVTHHINEGKNKTKLHDHLNREKAFNKIQHYFIIKAPRKLGIKGNMLK